VDADAASDRSGSSAWSQMSDALLWELAAAGRRSRGTGRPIRRRGTTGTGRRRSV